MMRPQSSYAARLIVFLQRAWRGNSRHVGQALQVLEGQVTPLSERPLLCFSAGLLSGSLLGTSVRLSPQLIGGILVAVVLVWRHWSSPQLQRCCRLVLLGLLLTHLPLAWQHRALPLNHIVHVLPAQPPQRITVEGRLDRPVASRGERQHVYIRLQRRRIKDGWQAVTGRIRLNIHAPSLPFLPGDVVRITQLRLHRVRGFLNPGSFNFQRHMQRQGVYMIGGVSNPKRLSLQQRPRGFLLARTLVHWRHRLQTLVRTHLPSPYDTVFLAMILGQRGNLSPDIQDQFRAAGTAHLLVVSGLHVGFVTMVVLVGFRTCLRLLRGWAPRTWLPAWRPTPLAALLSLPPILLYCSLVGWKVSTTRAALMICSYVLALIFERPRLLLHALGLAAALILLLDPQALFGLGFQLSFIAVAAIILVSQRVLWPSDAPETTRRWSQRLWAGILCSIAAYFGTLPLIAGAFHTIPTYGILANVLLMPLASVIVPAGVFALGLAAVWPALGAIVFAPLVPLLTWTVTLMQTIAALPNAQLHVAALSVPALAAYYGLLGSLLLPVRARWRLPGAGLCAAVLLVSISWQYIETRTRQLRVTFLDVGTGDAILVQAPGNHNMLIDGGGTYDGRFDIGAQVIAPFLWQRHIRRFDLMAMTHTHPNHARGLMSVFRMFPTQHVLTNGSPLTAEYLRDLLVVGRRRGAQVHTARDGPRQWNWERLQLTVLSPPRTTEQRRSSWEPPTENDRSLVIRLQYGTLRLLLTGDIQHATERWLLTQDADLRADILQIPHHGSRTSTLPAFVRRVRPQVGIMSVGAGNPYGHPHPEVMRTLAQHRVKLFRTDRHGAITIISDGNQYRIVPFRPYQPPLPAHVSPSS